MTFGDKNAVANASLTLAGLLQDESGLELFYDESISIAPFPQTTIRNSGTFAGDRRNLYWRRRDRCGNLSVLLR